MTAAPIRRLILASSSPRRRALLEEAGVRFEVVVPTLDEPNEEHSKLSPAQQAEALAYFKARAVAETHPDAVILGADTVVAAKGHLLGKPDDADDARRMLRTLSGTRHEVITGVALLGEGKRLIASDVTFVTMRRMIEEEIDGYIASREWEGKAGAYAIQETADRYIDRVEGSFSNVVGLPVELTLRMLAEFASRPGGAAAE